MYVDVFLTYSQRILKGIRTEISCEAFQGHAYLINYDHDIVIAWMIRLKYMHNLCGFLNFFRLFSDLKFEFIEFFWAKNFTKKTFPQS